MLLKSATDKLLISNQMTSKILINGNFLCRSLTGIERFAFETLKNLDEILTTSDDVSILVPSNAKIIPQYKNIKIIKSPLAITSFPKWDIFQFKKACKKNGAVGLNFSNTAPFGKHTGYAFLHDIYGYDCPEDFKNFRSRLIRIYSILHARNISHNAKAVFTVSEFSKNQIIKAFKTPSEKIKVIPNGWDHFKTVECDDSIFSKFPALKKGDFYFTLGSLQKRKNLKWIVDYAKNHPEDTFAISGKIVAGYKSDDISSLNDLSNVVLLGYVSDEEVKALMTACKAFVFPSLYEGFGIPPLEALSTGAKIVISDSASLPEIYKDSAVYINPEDSNCNLTDLLKKPCNKNTRKEVLDTYTYKNAALKLYEALKL